MKKNISILIIGLLTSSLVIAQEYTKFDITQNKLCIPNEYIKNTTPIEKDNTGVWLHNSINNNYLFPKNISSVIIDKKINDYNPNTIKKLKDNKVFVYLNSLKEGKILEINNQYISVNDGISIHIIKSKNQQKIGSLYNMNDNDEIIAGCDMPNENKKSNHCARTVFTKHYKLFYRFYIDGQYIPSFDIEELDKQIDKQIQKWDCEKIKKEPTKKEKTIDTSNNFDIMKLLYGKWWCIWPFCNNE